MTGARKGIDLLFKALNDLLARPAKDLTVLDVMNVCTMFGMLNEHGLHCLVHAAHGIKPMVSSYCELPVGNTLGSLLKLAFLPCKKDAKYGMQKDLFPSLPPQVFHKAQAMFTAWMPKYAMPGNTEHVVYNRSAYWLATVRILRNIASHQSFYFIQEDAGANGGVVIKVPSNPVKWLVAGQGTKNDFYKFPVVGCSLPAIWSMMNQGLDEFAVCGMSGYIDVPVDEFRVSMSHVVADVYKGWLGLFVELESVL